MTKYFKLNLDAFNYIKSNTRLQNNKTTFYLKWVKMMFDISLLYIDYETSFNF